MPGASALATSMGHRHRLCPEPAPGHACRHVWQSAGSKTGSSLEGCTTLWLMPLTNRPLVDSRSMGMCALRASV